MLNEKLDELAQLKYKLERSGTNIAMVRDNKCGGGHLTIASLSKWGGPFATNKEREEAAQELFELIKNNLMQYMEQNK